MDARQTVAIYKATQRGKGQQLLKEGFLPDNFPYSPPNADGKCYFAAPNSRSLAEEYNKYYKDGILEVTIALEAYDDHFRSLERAYQGGAQVELAIPHSLFSILNKFPRALKLQ